MVIIKTDIARVKLAAELHNKGVNWQAIAIITGVGRNIISRYAELYIEGEQLIEKRQIVDICTGSPIKIAREKLNELGLDMTRTQLAHWCYRNGVKYMAIQSASKIAREKLNEIEDKLRDDDLETLQQVADSAGVSLHVVWKASQRMGVKKKRFRTVSPETQKVIDNLYEATNGMTVAKLVAKIGCTRTKVRTAINTIRRRPSDYELEQSMARGVVTYKITAITVSRKSQKANDRRVRMREMITAGDTNEMIAIELKCSNATIDKLRDVMSPRQGIKKPSSMNPAMAAFLGIKL